MSNSPRYHTRSKLHRKTDGRHQGTAAELDVFHLIPLLVERRIGIFHNSGTDRHIGLFQSAHGNILQVDIHAKRPFREIKILIDPHIELGKSP